MRWSIRGAGTRPFVRGLMGCGQGLGIYITVQILVPQGAGSKLTMPLS